MPIYEYRCLDCGHAFERMQKFSDAPLTECPSCAGHVQKLISRSAFHLKGDGWYVTDYARKSGTNGTTSSHDSTSSTSEQDQNKKTSTESKTESKTESTSSSSQTAAAST